MNELFEPVDEHDRDLALNAPPTLATFNGAGVITAADVHIAATLGRLGGESDPDVLLAIALTSRAVRHGSVCLELALAGSLLTDIELPWPDPTSWSAAVARSPLVALGVLHWEHGLLYLDRYHEQERQVLDDLTARATSTPAHDPSLLAGSLARVFPDPGFDEQRAA